MPLARIEISQLQVLAKGIQRPEDVVVSREGRVFASAHDCAVAEILPDGGFRRLGPKGGAPNGLAMDREGRILIANFGIYDGEPGPLQRFDPASERHETLLRAVEGRTLTASNYPVVDSSGAIWCANSTSAPTWPDALDGRADGFVYVLKPDGGAAIVADRLKFPNGMALSGDGRTLFVNQTTGGDVLAFPVRDGWRLGDPRRYGPKLGFVANRKLNPRLRLPGLIRQFLGYTDGNGFDAEGNLWVTLPAAHKIVAIRPDGQVFTIAHDLEGRVLNGPTNIAWGGQDLTDLYIGSLYADYVLKAKSPVPGAPLTHQR